MVNGTGKTIGRMPASSFSFTMSTGIVSISALIHGEGQVSAVLLLIGITALLTIGSLYTLKIALMPVTFKNEFLDHKAFLGFFTVSAGLDVISTRLMLSYPRPDDYMFFLVSVGFLLLFSFILLAKLYRGHLHFDRDTVTSEWLNIPVAIEASAISMSIYFQSTGHPDAFEFIFILGLVLAGFMTYAAVNLIEAVNLFSPGTRREFSGMFFVNMGAGAILSLASLELLMVLAPASTTLIQEILKVLFVSGGIYSTIWLQRK